MSSWSIKLGFGVPVLAAFAATQVGCADERAPINQVQPLALSKSFFLGAKIGNTPEDLQDDPEFYTATMVTDVPYGTDAAQVFPGLTAGVRRIKWEVTETHLNARQTYEDIDGSDGHGKVETANGKVIASFGIEKHFDIQRAYNSSTGEELNVVVENASDRPWYEREYMRVDWSTNMITSSYNWDPLLLYSALSDGASTEPLSYYVDDPNHPDAPHFESEAGYFDITNKVYFAPKMLTIEGQTLPACFYRGAIVIGATAPWGQCEASEVTYRMSFNRVPVPGDANFTDYEARHWDGARMNAFGAFTTDRLGWDDHYGVVDDRWVRFIQRYNIWQASHAKDGNDNYYACASQETYSLGQDPTRDENNDGTDDECAAVGVGSRCDTFAKQCTIPFAKREVRPVAWYYTIGAENDDPETPEVEMTDPVIYESTERATWAWDTAMRIAVLSARLVECRKTQGASIGADVAKCEELFAWDQRDDAENAYVENRLRCEKAKGVGNCKDKIVSNASAMDPVVAICHSPVAESDAAACGPAGRVVRPGDIRYHQLNMWPTRVSLSPWGYGPSGADPLTGEVLSALVNVYDSVTDSAAQSFVDQLRWLNGELTSSEITSGEYVRGWADTPAAKAPGTGFRYSKEELDKRVGGLKNAAPIGDSARSKLELAALRDKIGIAKLSKDAMRDLSVTRLEPGVVGDGQAEFEARINMAKDSPIEAALMGPMWTQLAGTGDSTQWEPDAARDLSSPLRGMRSHLIREGTHELQKILAQNGQCILQAPEPTGLPALAKIMNQKFPPLEAASPGQDKGRLVRMYDYLRGNMNYSVILHEMGHTITLRHNFVGSYDKLNYRPQYWQLRTSNGDVKEPCVGPQDDGANCVGPRYYDPYTQAEVDNSIHTWQHTTIMDYPGDLTQDMVGLGVYDYAAARFAYADVMDVRNDGVLLQGTEEGNNLIDLVDRAGGITGQWVFRGNNSIVPYPEWNNYFGLLWNCRDIGANPEEDAKRNLVRPDWWDDAKWGIWNAVFDGHVVTNSVCERAPVDFVGYRDMVGDSLEDYLNSDPKYFTPRRTHDSALRPRMPYGFESDEYADGWSPSSYRHDNGADLYEELVFHSSLYEDRHLFDSFRNGRSTFTVYGGYSRALSRYHSKIAALGQGFAFLHDYYWKEIARNRGFSIQDLNRAYEAEGGPMRDHAIASSLAFDHFVRVLTRPHVGLHYRTAVDPVIHPLEDVVGAADTWTRVVTIPNGTSVGKNGDVMFGGRPINNQFQYGQGYWSSDYINQTGAYYEKTYALEMLLEASSRSFNFYRWDGIDARFRHVNFTNLFPEGMRRLIGLLLTGDQTMYAPRLSTSGGLIETETAADGTDYPKNAMAWPSFVHADGPQMCWPANGQLACSDTFGESIQPAGAAIPTESVAVDPQLGWEVQKFVAFWAYVYMPGRQDFDWVDMMRIFQVGTETDPDYLPEQRIEWRDPTSGRRYIAKRYGVEKVFGKDWDKGVAAKMIQWANELTAKAYVLDATTPFDPVTGAANVTLDLDGNPVIKSDPATTPSDPTNLTCEDNSQCLALRRYRGMLDMMRDIAAQVGFPEPALQIFGGG